MVIDIEQPTQIADLITEPILQPGRPGEFDDSGAMASWLVQDGNQRYLYYIGWNLAKTVPFRNSIGLAVSAKGEPFRRYADGPILDRTIKEPHFCASSCVRLEGELWRMWYLSCTEWMIQERNPVHKYHIKYAESEDGIHWERDGFVAIDYKDRQEYAISRPSVLEENGIWKMWFSCRGNAYQIGYAESGDGMVWERMDSLAGLHPSEKGWDSEMVEYPFVFDHKGSRFLLYNGNGYGQTGFGIAVLD
jgi:hypothetical protein